MIFCKVRFTAEGGAIGAKLSAEKFVIFVEKMLIKLFGTIGNKSYICAVEKCAEREYVYQ